ncbi:hypothetical protein ACH5RR_007454 [Cinchona calisaya]|uniref:Zinc finger PHD-type domain-containing protein n=1 Tax=Cinchona calisaya TaxID=153742 RepID=A0ABD3ARV1_9GENT
MGQIQSAHEHLLCLKSTVDENVADSLGCRGCRRIIKGPHYICPDGCNYSVHALCISLPDTIDDHPLHPKHRLELVPRPPDQYLSECRVCGKCCKGFTYHCLKCTRFDIDILCAWVPRRIEMNDAAHEHPFTLFLKPAIFSCDACHSKLGEESMSYMCFTCQYWVHIDCAPAPHYLEIGYESIFHHRDPIAAKETQCQICHQEVKEVYEPFEKTVYSPFDTASDTRHPDRITSPASTRSGLGIEFEDLYFHVGCFTLATRSLPSVEASLMGNTSTNILLPSWSMIRDELHDDVTTQRESEIKHWSHDDHVLKLGTTTDDIPEFDRSRIKCNGCNWPLLAPFYTCGHCNFFLHENCAQLHNTRKTLKTSIHNHRLSICLNPTDTNRNKMCSNCNNSFTGFSYKCGNCDSYILDLSCAKIRDSITHDAHEHKLFLSDDDQSKMGTINCNACGNSCCDKQQTYVCTLCEFYLHLKCAFLPRKSRHRFDRHSLTLMFKSDHNELEEYICDICEDEKRNPNHWFYGCNECDFAAHVDCIFDQ